MESTARRDSPSPMGCGQVTPAGDGFAPGDHWLMNPWFVHRLIKEHLCGGSHSQGSKEYRQVAGLKDADGLTALQLAATAEFETREHAPRPPALKDSIEQASGLVTESQGLTPHLLDMQEHMPGPREIRRHASEMSQITDQSDQVPMLLSCLLLS